MANENSGLIDCQTIVKLVEQAEAKYKTEVNQLREKLTRTETKLRQLQDEILAVQETKASSVLVESDSDLVAYQTAIRSLKRWLVKCGQDGDDIDDDLERSGICIQCLCPTSSCEC